MTQAYSCQIFSTIALPFLTYLFLFVGMGLVAGSVVHFGETDQIPRFLTIGFVGMVLFILSSYIQESVLGSGNVKKEGTLRYVFYSLILAIGIGMISGGTQHFLDFPQYASYLLPVGFVLALVAYVLRNNIGLTRKGWSLLLGTALLIALPVFGGLNLYARALPAGAGHSHGGHGHGSAAPAQANAAQANAAQTDSGSHGGMNHEMTVTSEEDFLLGMVPHHQEAVDTSAYVMTRTPDGQLAAFTEGVVAVQAKEIRQMKQWYQAWFGKPYQDNGMYQPMMGDLSRLRDGALDRAYMEGMIGHHEGAIDMAKQLLPLTQRPELKAMAEAIITTQRQEVEQLQQWLAQQPSSGASPATGQHGHDSTDGHPH